MILCKKLNFGDATVDISVDFKKQIIDVFHNESSRGYSDNGVHLSNVFDIIEAALEELNVVNIDNDSIRQDILIQLGFKPKSPA